jgi:hypothetical protein
VLTVVLLLVAGCGDGGSSPDPGAPGGKSEIDGGETGTDDGASTSTSVVDQGMGGTSGGGTQGNQIAPGDTTQPTAQGNG